MYTDSRGHEITSPWAKKNPFSSYVGDLIREYDVSYAIAPKRHTTILDFLVDVGDRAATFDVVVLHCGIVDFSPRPKSDLERVYRTKWGTLTRFLPAEELRSNLASTDLGSYEGEATAPIYLPEMADRYVLPHLTAIPNLVWIGPNRILPDWRGNYHRDRPTGMTIVETFAERFVEALPRTVDLMGWTDEEIRRFTVDNIHLSAEGFRTISGALRRFLPESRS